MTHSLLPLPVLSSDPVNLPSPVPAPAAAALSVAAGAPFSRCQHCGAAMPGSYIDERAHAVMRRDGGRTKLPLQMWLILNLLRHAMPDAVSHELIGAEIWGEGDHYGAVANAVTRLRAVLIGTPLEVINDRGAGYRLVSAP